MLSRFRTQTAMFGRRDLAAVLLTGLTGAVILAVNFGTGVATARLLGAEGRGELAAMILWPQLFGFLAVFGLPSAAIYSISKRPADAGALAGAGLAATALSGSAVALAGAAALPYLMHGVPEHIVNTAVRAMILVPFTGAGLTLVMLILARRDFRWTNRARVLPPLLTGLGIAGLALCGAAAPGPVAIAYLAGGPLAMLIVLACVWRRLAPSLANLTANAKELLGYGLRAYAGELAGILYLHFDRLLLIVIAGPRVVGFYAVAYNLSRLVPVLIEHSVSTMLSPKASAAGFADARRLTLSAAAGGAAAAVLLIAPLLVLAGWLLTTLYGVEFAASARAFQILLIDALIFSVTGILCQGFLATGRPFTMFWLNLAGLVSGGAAMLLLCDGRSIEMPALALLTGTLCRFLLSLFLFVSMRFELPPLIAFTQTPG